MCAKVFFVSYKFGIVNASVTNPSKRERGAQGRKDCILVRVDRGAGDTCSGSTTTDHHDRRRTEDEVYLGDKEVEDAAQRVRVLLHHWELRLFYSVAKPSAATGTNSPTKFDGRTGGVQKSTTKYISLPVDKEKYGEEKIRNYILNQTCQFSQAVLSAEFRGKYIRFFFVQKCSPLMPPRNVQNKFIKKY